MICGVQIEKLESIKKHINDSFEVERSKDENVKSRVIEDLQPEPAQDLEELKELDQERPLFNNRERCFYFLKEKRSIIVDLARLSFARIDESLSDSIMSYKQRVSSGIKLVKNRKAGFCLKIPINSSFMKDFEGCLNETITFREDFEKYILVQTETLKRFTITRNQSEQEILCETFQ